MEIQMPEPVYIIKGPEQLEVEDIIPKAGDYLVVESVTWIDPALSVFGENGINVIPNGYHVTFTDGSFATYPIGSAIRVGE
jgi:hypothetical protein